MLRGLLKLTWLEVKIFVREPMGVFGTVGMPVLIFLFVSRLASGGGRRPPRGVNDFLRTDLPVLVAVFITISAVLSLVTIISIYREGGILKRLRATPLRPWTILAAHVLVKLLFSAATVVLMLLAGRRYLPPGVEVRALDFGAAVILSTWSILSIGFVIASLVPTARFAQLISAAVVYPMIPFSGLLFPISLLAPPFQRMAAWMPLTYAVSLLRGIWSGDPWLAHLNDVAALVLVFVVCTALSAKVFRWE
jgi:ABC-2 type transport system permease protein